MTKAEKQAPPRRRRSTRRSTAPNVRTRLPTRSQTKGSEPMRAFMSDRTHARRTVACGRVGSTLADMAEREARRILAETEPENSRSYHGRAYIPDGILPHHEALAEALAAFVAEEE